jgi:UDP-2,3-diacylglucosamine hydrolase
MHESSMTPKPVQEAQPQTVALFVSDLHLQAALPRTTQAFFDFLQRAMKSQQLYLLGDIFEYWAGDDDMAAPYNQRVVDAIRAVSDSGVKVFWMAGNRDFLVGVDFARASGATILPDPFVATLAGRRLVLTHGDAQCTDDVAYMEFRAQVRQADWQQQFLAMPLVQRKAIIDGMRSESRAAQSAKSCDIMDVNAGAIVALFESSATSLMIHGHTHRPARHQYGEGNASRVRYVLPDWDCEGESARGGWIALDSDGAIKRYDVAGAEQL